MRKSQSDHNEMRIHQVILILIILVATAYKVSLIPQSEFSGHAGQFFDMARDAIHTRSPPLIGHYNPLLFHYGPYIVYLTIPFVFIWENPLVMFVLLAAMSVITIYFIYRIGEIVSGSRTGLIGSTLYAFNYVSYNLDAYTYFFYAGIAAPVIVILIYSILKIILENRQKQWTTAIICSAILLQTGIGHFFSPLLLLLPISKKTKTAGKYILIGLIATLVLFTPLVIYTYNTDFSEIRNIPNSYQEVRNNLYGSYVFVTEDLFIGALPFAAASLILLLWIPIYKRHGKVMLVLISTAVLNILWVLPFPYLSFYYVEHVFLCTFLIIAIVANDIIDATQKKLCENRNVSPKKVKTFIIAALVVLLIIYSLANMQAVRERQKNNLTTISLQRQIVDAVRDTLGDIRINKTPGDWYHVIYIDGAGDEWYTNSLLESSGTRLVDNSILILPENYNITSNSIETKIVRVADRKVVIFENKIKKVMLSTDATPGWQETYFNDSSWKEKSNHINLGELYEPNLDNSSSVYIRSHIRHLGENTRTSWIIRLEGNQTILDEVYFNGVPQKIVIRDGITQYTTLINQVYGEDSVLAIKINRDKLVPVTQIYLFQI